MSDNPLSRFTPLVLCGGESTRLPHKLFLCDRHGDPMILSAIRAARRLVGPDVYIELLCSAENRSALTSLLSSVSGRFPELAPYRFELSGGLGVVGCLNQHADQSLLVFTGDNYYSPFFQECCFENVSNFVQRYPGTPGCVTMIRRIYGEPCSVELDGYSWELGRWVRRSSSARIDQHLATPWVFPSYRRSSCPSVVDLLNDLNAQTIFWRATPEHWMDVGTVQNFKHHHELCQ